MHFWVTRIEMRVGLDSIYGSSRSYSFRLVSRRDHAFQYDIEHHGGVCGCRDLMRKRKDYQSLWMTCRQPGRVAKRVKDRRDDGFGMRGWEL